MIDGLMKAFFQYAGISKEKAKEMVEGTYHVVETIGKDMTSINARLDRIEKHLEAKSVAPTDQ